MLVLLRLIPGNTEPVKLTPFWLRSKSLAVPGWTLLELVLLPPAPVAVWGSCVALWPLELVTVFSWLGFILTIVGKNLTYSHKKQDRSVRNGLVWIKF